MIGITPATHGMSQKWNFCQIGAELAPEQAKLALAVVQVAAKWNLSMALWPGMQIISAPATVVPHLAIIQEISLGFGHLAGTISFAPFLLADCEFSPCKAAGREQKRARQSALQLSSLQDVEIKIPRLSKSRDALSVILETLLTPMSSSIFQQYRVYLVSVSCSDCSDSEVPRSLIQ